MNISGKNVMMQAHAQYRGPLTAIARSLKADGANIYLYVTNADQIAHYQDGENEGLFAAIVDTNILYPACAAPLPSMVDVVTQSQAVESELGVAINELAMSDRHLGRGFALGGYGHPRSRISESSDYRAMLHGFNSLYAFWRREIDDKAPALFINPEKIPARMMRQLGRPIRILAGSRYKNFHYWAHDEYFYSPQVSEHLDSSETTAAVDFNMPYDDHLKWRQYFSAQTRPWQFIKSVAHLLARRAWWQYKGYEKAKGYYISEELRYTLSLFSGSRKLSKFTKPLTSLIGERFAYFPLHMEPEVALQQLSPECFAQLAVIASIARDLPAGVRLAVKETASAIGRRPSDVYGQLREFKNVVLLDVYELGLEVVKQCDVVLTITGTGGFEGAVLGKPVISFGRHNIYSCVPHVQVVKDIGDLRGPLAQALDHSFDSKKARHDGARLLSTVIATSFDMDGFTSRKPDAVTPKAFDAAYAALEKSLV